MYQEKLFVTDFHLSGLFFGQFEKRLEKDVGAMFTELKSVYASNAKSLLLYADTECHLGHFAVVEYDDDPDDDRNFFRARIIKEYANEAVVQLIDFGNCPKLSKSLIFAPVTSLNIFRLPPMGIHCYLDVQLDGHEWGQVIFEKNVVVRIERCVNELYSVTLTEDKCNDKVARAIAKTVSSKIYPKRKFSNS